MLRDSTSYVIVSALGEAGLTTLGVSLNLNGTACLVVQLSSLLIYLLVQLELTIYIRTHITALTSP